MLLKEPLLKPLGEPIQKLSSGPNPKPGLGQLEQGIHDGRVLERKVVRGLAVSDVRA